MQKFQNTKTFFLKDMLLIIRKKFLQLVKSRTLYNRHMLLMFLMVKKLLEKEMQKKNQEEFSIGKVIKRKIDELYVK